MEFKNKTMIVTGASSGMGLLCSQNFAELGGNIVMVALPSDNLNAAVEQVNQIRAGSAIGIPCDVRDYQQVCYVRDETIRVFGTIDILVNFAGGAGLRILNANHGQELPETPIEVFDWSIDVNLKGQMYFDHAVLPQMRAQKSGVIINIGSISGKEGCSQNLGYACAKSGAMNGLTKSIAKYGAPYGIRCCCVSPGPVLTRPGMAALKTPLGRAAEPQEVVDLVLYLASDKAAFITGVDILIDGGYNITIHEN